MAMISVSVMAHPKREDHIDYLHKQLGPVPVAWDRKDSVWDTAKRAWDLHGDQSAYHVVVQDDAIICDDFYERLQSIILAYPDSAYCLYMGENLKSLKGNIERPVTVGKKIQWGVAICLPVIHIKKALAFGDRWNNRYGTMHDDTRLSRYCQSKSLNVVYPVPSLIDHRHSPSLIGDSVGRKAYEFVQ